MTDEERQNFRIAALEYLRDDNAVTEPHVQRRIADEIDRLEKELLISNGALEICQGELNMAFYTAPPRPGASAETAELQERCVEAQRLAFQWMERHDKVVGFIRKNYPSVMFPDLPFPSPVSRPDASVIG